MEDKIKKIISRYTKIPVEQINPNTVIDRSAVTGSILVHRMYANLSAEGFTVENYWDIKTFGMLLQRINGASVVTQPMLLQPETVINHSNIENNNSMFNGIGIDIEEINSMPQVNDFREDDFYKMNFTATEIAYCILQQNVLASFAGLFAAKEAIVKADNSYQNKPFNTIFIDHLPTGKPVHNQFQLSISHTDKVAVAMAAAIAGNSSPSQSPALTGVPIQSSKSNHSFATALAVLAFLISLASILVIFFRH